MGIFSQAFGLPRSYKIDDRPQRSAAISSAVPTAAWSASPIIPAATVITRTARDRAAWVADRQAELLPVQYFHVVFTVPAPVAAIALQNKPVVYDILFRAAAETLRTIAADPRHLGAEIGVVAVLHSWGQNLQHHLHVHCLVPAATYRSTGCAEPADKRVSSYRSRSSHACSGGCFSIIYRGHFQTCHSLPGY